MATTTTITLEELERLPEDECGEVIRGEMRRFGSARPRST